MKMFVVNLNSPHCPIREVEMTLSIGNNGNGWAWAINGNGKRYLIGSSAFHTFASAEHRQISEVKKRVNSSYVKKNLPFTYKSCVDFLKGVKFSFTS